ncbi:MAG: PAS domain-containing protein, partial [Tangfeifania sp.]
MQFEFTPVAKFVADNNRIIMMNPAFKQLTGLKRRDGENPKIDVVFDFSEQDNNLLNYRKCLNGLKDSCLFQSVMVKANNLLRFDIHLVCTGYLEEGLLMAEIVPAGGFNG